MVSLIVDLSAFRLLCYKTFDEKNEVFTNGRLCTYPAAL